MKLSDLYRLNKTYNFHNSGKTESDKNSTPISKALFAVHDMETPQVKVDPYHISDPLKYKDNMEVDDFQQSNSDIQGAKLAKNLDGTLNSRSKKMDNPNFIESPRQRTTKADSTVPRLPYRTGGDDAAIPSKPRHRKFFNIDTEHTAS